MREIREYAKSRVEIENACIPKREDQTNSVASCARPSLSVHLCFSFSLSRASFYQLVWDSISLTCRIARCASKRHELTIALFRFAPRFSRLFSISFTLSLFLYHENVPVSKSLTTSKARCNKFELLAHTWWIYVKRMSLTLQCRPDGSSSQLT